MIVIGTDTHKRTHTCGAVFAGTGQLAGELTAPAREPGFRELLAWGMEFMLGRDLRGKRLGIVGLGAIGRRVAQRARAFGMRISYNGRHEADPGVAAELEGSGSTSRRCWRAPTSSPCTARSPIAPGHLIAAPQLAQMKPGAILVNAARGAIVDEPALVGALRDGRLAAAALDVYEHEPAVHPGLLEMENVTLVPHLGSATAETRRAMAELAARNAVAAVRGERLPTPVPPAG